jgi:hypothetical protein
VDVWLGNEKPGSCAYTYFFGFLFVLCLNTTVCIHSWCLYVCMCVYVCMYVCMYVCVCERACVCVPSHVYVFCAYFEQNHLTLLAAEMAAACWRHSSHDDGTATAATPWPRTPVDFAAGPPPAHVVATTPLQNVLNLLRMQQRSARVLAFQVETIATRFAAADAAPEADEAHTGVPGVDHSAVHVLPEVQTRIAAALTAAQTVA